MRCFISKTNKKNFDKLVLVIGGGSIVDKAKIYAKKHGKICLAIPTTGAGATETNHAVIWGKEKKNIQTDIPIGIRPPFEVKLPKQIRKDTMCDIIGHVIDYLRVCTDNELIDVGIYAGKLIQKHHTNLTHPLSYPLTLKKKIPHGRAVGMVLQESIERLLNEKT